jgi:hypothetical protein
MKIPVIINNRDLLSWPKAMVEKIATYDNVGEIVIVDNASSYKPLIEWYRSQSIANIIYCDNLGHAAPWISQTVQHLNSPYYVVSDSDLGLENTPTDTLTVLAEKLSSIVSINKLGLGLNWQIVNKNSPYYERLNLFECDRWTKSSVVNEAYLDVAIDTTFAMYNKNHYFIGGASLSYPYVARHYPWELSMDHGNNEFKYYIERASSSSSYKLIVPNTYI